MPSPWTDTQNAIVEGLGFARLSICTMSGGEITGFGSAIDITMVTDEDTEDANLRDAEKTYLEKKLTTQITVRLDVTSSQTILNAATGTAVSKDAANNDYLYFKGMIAYADYNTLVDSVLKASAATPVVMIIGEGKTAAGTNLGYRYLLGYIDGNLKKQTSGEIVEQEVKVVGGTSFTANGATEATLNGVATGASNTIEPVGKSALTITALTSGDFTTLLTGQIVKKAAA